MFEALKNGIKLQIENFVCQKIQSVYGLDNIENDGLIDQRNGHNNIPHKTFKTIEQKLSLIVYKLFAMKLEN